MRNRGMLVGATAIAGVVGVATGVACGMGSEDQAIDTSSRAGGESAGGSSDGGAGGGDTVDLPLQRELPAGRADCSDVDGRATVTTSRSRGRAASIRLRPGRPTRARAAPSRPADVPFDERQRARRRRILYVFAPARAVRRHSLDGRAPSPRNSPIIGLNPEPPAGTFVRSTDPPYASSHSYTLTWIPGATRPITLFINAENGDAGLEMYGTIHVTIKPHRLTGDPPACRFHADARARRFSAPRRIFDESLRLVDAPLLLGAPLLARLRRGGKLVGARALRREEAREVGTGSSRCSSRSDRR